VEYAENNMATKKVGYTNPRWSLKVAVQQQVELEDRIAWAKRKEESLEYVYKPAKFELSETAKHVFARGIHFIKSSIA
jgi:hypothetical protein